MREAIDYNALNWVRVELGETLRQARLELESYSESKNRTEILQRCAAQLHQARGPLRMVELRGADLLAAEMEEAIADLLLGTVTDQTTLLEFLLQGFLELPEYLFSLRSGRRDTPQAMFPVINSLRAARGLEPLGAEDIFSPNLSSRVPASVFDVRAWHNDSQLVSRARAARVRFQSGLLEWYRSGPDSHILNALIEVLEQLQAMACSEPVARLWWVGAGVAEMLRDEVMQDSPVVKRLFGQLDRNIKRLMEYGEQVFSDLLTDDLLRNLLFQIALVNGGGERIALIRQTYGLGDTLLQEGHDTVLSDELLQTVATNARGDIERIKQQLDECATSPAPATFEQLADDMHSLGNLLGMIGLDELGSNVGGHEQTLRDMQPENGQQLQTDCNAIAGTLVAVEDALVDISSHLGASAGEDKGEVAFRQGQEAVIDAILEDMIVAKEAVNSYLRSGSNSDTLADVPSVLHRITGALELAGQPRLAATTDRVRTFIGAELLDARRTLDQSELDSLADVICSVEFCVEELRNNHSFGDRAMEVAEQSLAMLGYPLEAPRQADADADVQATAAADVPATEVVADEPVEAAATVAEADVPHEDAAAVVEELQAAVVTIPAVQAATGDSLSALPVVGAEADPEIVEIFIEEAGDVLQELTALIPHWSEHPADADCIATIRRGFHTLKGSGRMIGALATGEFAWAFEQLMNRVIDNTVSVSAQLQDLVGQALPALQQLVARVSETSHEPVAGIDTLAARALALASGAPLDVAEEADHHGVDEAVAEAAGTEPVSGHAAAADDAAPVQSPSLPVAGLPVLSADADPEIVDIFLEEAEEALLSLRVAISGWIAAPEDSAALAEVRRGFHTLKGSGRMAGAMQLGELAWHVEALLNKLLEGTLQPVARMNVYLAGLPDAMQTMLGRIRGEETSGPDIEALMARADEFASNLPGEAAGVAVADHMPAGQVEPAPFDSAASDIAPEQGADADTPAVIEAMEPERSAVEWQPDTAAGGQEQDGADMSSTLEDGPDTTLLDLFTVECAEHLATLARSVAQADAAGSITPELFRALHTLSGISESAQVTGIGALAEPLYDYFGTLYHEQRPAIPAAFALLDDCVREMQQQHARLPQLTFDEWAVAQLQHRIFALAGPAAEAQQPVLPDSVPAGAMAVEEIRLEAVPFDAAGRVEEITPAQAAAAGADDHGDIPADAVAQTHATIEQPVMAQDDANVAVIAAEDPYAGIDPELFDIFIEESTEIMQSADAMLREWSGAPDNAEFLAAFKRMLHTLKGGARMVEISAVGDLSHMVESLLEHVSDGTLDAGEELFALLDESLDRLADMLELVSARNATGTADELLQRLQGFAAGDISAATVTVAAVMEPATTGTPVDTGPVVSAEVAADAVDIPEPGAIAADDPVGTTDQADMAAEPVLRMVAASPEFPAFSELTARSAALRTATGTPVAGATPGHTEQVRISAELLDNLVGNSGEISIYRSRMEQQISRYRFNLGELDQTIARTREQLRKLEMETEAQILFRFEQEADDRNADFDPLEMDRYSTLQQLSRSLIESISDLQSLQEILEHTTRDAETLLLQQSRVNSDMQESLIRSRMIPFAGLAPRLRRIVRQTARELNKKVELELHGADGEMDRSVADRIVAPLEHMLRNAVAHGIEMPEQRTRSGKPATGAIRIDFDRDGPEIVLRISDDGAGIDVAAVRERAVERGLLDADAEISDQELSQFILMSGFSTATEVTQISGRGVGMDVVGSEVKQLGGSLLMQSTSGGGTLFTVRLPYTLAINQALLVNAGEGTFFVPLANIEGVVRVYPEELFACYRSKDQLFGYAGNQYRLKHLGTLLGAGGMQLQHERQQVPVLLLRIGDQRVGLQVEQLLGNREVVIKPMGTQFSSIVGISGATILGDGRVVLILDMVAVARMHASPLLTDLAIRPQTDSRLVVMVVDDSITVRKVTTRLLERNGYQVLTAKDGVDAMGQLQETLPDMMLLDIEMPRMDGFELATHMRNDERMRYVPIIMITSRTGDKHRERAQAIGVNEYLGKPYQESDLLAAIQQIIGANPVAAAG